MKWPLNPEQLEAQAAAKREGEYRREFKRRLENTYATEGIEGPLAQALLRGATSSTLQTIAIRSFAFPIFALVRRVKMNVARRISEEELKRISETIHKDKLRVDLARKEIQLRYPFAVVRQEAVGHGGFHTGVLGFSHPQFRWVYDCGSWHKRDALKRRISDFLERARRYGGRDIDLLFLSHFDADHVNGLEILFAGRDEVPTTVDTVVAPYLDPVDRFATLGRAVAQNKCPPYLIDAVAHPENYFGDRGVRRIILVRPEDDPGTPGGEESRSPSPHLPTLPRDKYVPFAVDAFTAGGQFLPLEGTQRGKLDLYVVEPGLIFEASSEKRWLDWIFVPHAYRWRFNRARLVSRIRKAVGLDPNDPEFCAALVRLLRTKKGLNDVKKIYCGMDSNGTSLTLYAGPGYRGIERRSFTREAPVGWLMTGDAPLNRSDAFIEWKQSYTSLSEHTGRLMLPHHGAQRNFNPELFAFAGSAAPFLTVDKKDYDEEKRPPVAVRRKIPRPFDVVTERSGLIDVSGEPCGADVWREVLTW